MTAANDPGHDNLYVLKVGDNVTGSLNLTGGLTASSLRTASLIYGNYLDIWANGTLQSVTSRPAIQAPNAASLYLDSTQNIYIATQGGTVNVVQFGPTGSSNLLIVNVSGQLLQQNIPVCLANGTNCPGSLSSANITGSGTTNYVTKWTSTTNLGTSLLYDTGTNIGIGTTIPSATLTVNSSALAGSFLVQNTTGSNHVFVNGSTGFVGIATTAAFNTLSVNGSMNASGNVYDNNNRVCTSYNGFCGSGGANVSGSGTANYVARWSNTTSLSTGVLYDNGTNVGIGTATPNALLDVRGNAIINSSATTGSLQVFNATGSTHLFVNGNTGYVGIGTVTPTEKLDVSGSLNVSGTAYLASTNLTCSQVSGCVVGAISSFPYQSGAAGWLNSTNQVFLANNNTNVTVDNGNLFVDNTNNRVGIGTTMPAGVLHVYQGNYGVGLRISRNASLGPAILQFSDDVAYANYIQMQNGSSNLIIAPSGGNVGIGTTGPGTTLDIAGAGNTQQFRVSALTPTTGYTLMSNGNGGGTGYWLQESSTGGTLTGGLAYATLFGSATNTATQIITNGIAKMTILASGDVGIGTTAPSEKLAVFGNISSTTGAVFATSSGNVGVGTTTPSEKFAVVGNISSTMGAVFATSSGNVGIGTSPGQKLEVYGAGLFDWAGGNNGTVYLGDTNHGIKSTSGGGVTIFSYGVTNGIYLQQSTGNVGIGTNTPSEKLSVNGNISSTTGAYFATSSGNVGIGTIAPNASLDIDKSTDGALAEFQRISIHGSSNLTGGKISFWQWGVAEKGSLATQYLTSGNGWNTILDGYNLRFRTNYGTDSMVILNSGNVGIGTTAPTQILDARGSLNVSNLIYIQASAQTTCNAAAEGAIYYNGTTHKHYGCNSTNWNALY